MKVTPPLERGGINSETVLFSGLLVDFLSSTITESFPLPASSVVKASKAFATSGIVSSSRDRLTQKPWMLEFFVALTTP